jgi:RES domain-containing protein
MHVYRITRRQYANLEGIGGLFVAGRWHEKGYRVVYFSESRSLALLEYLVHLADYDLLPADIVIITLKIPSSTHIIKADPSTLKPGWEKSMSITRSIGTEFLKNKKGPVLRVPTTIVPGEFNFVINPLHEDISNFKITNTETLILDNRFS